MRFLNKEVDEGLRGCELEEEKKKKMEEERQGERVEIRCVLERKITQKKKGVVRKLNPY